MTELQIDSIGNEYLFNTISKEFPEATFSFFVMSPQENEQLYLILFQM